MYQFVQTVKLYLRYFLYFNVNHILLTPQFTRHIIRNTPHGTTFYNFIHDETKARIKHKLEQIFFYLNIL